MSKSFLVRRSLVVLAALAASSFAGAFLSQPSAEVVLARIKRAVFQSPVRPGEALEFTGRIWNGSLEQAYDIVFSASGPFRESTSGKLGQSSGFDGKMAWQVDPSGMPAPLSLESRESVLLPMLFSTGAWLTNPALFDVHSDDRHGTPEAWALSVKLRGGNLLGLALIDRKTALPASLSFEGSRGPRSWKFTGYSKLMGRNFPCEWTNRSGDVYRIERGKKAPTSAVFRMPTARPSDVSFDVAAPHYTEIMEAKSGHILVKPLIDGKDVGWFILDTGSGAQCIDSKIAEELQMEVLGQRTATGAGAQYRFKYRRSQQMRLGPLTIHRPLFIAIDLSDMSKDLGVKVSGIVGYDFFARSECLIDTANKTLGVWAPGTWQDEGEPWQAACFSGGGLVAEFRFDNVHRDEFGIDTGSDNTLDIYAKGLRLYGFLGSKQMGTGTGSGAGGSYETKESKIDLFSIAGREFRNLPITISLARAGAARCEYLAGNIGMGVLRHFRLLLDYPDQRVALLPNPAP